MTGAVEELRRVDNDVDLNQDDIDRNADDIRDNAEMIRRNQRDLNRLYGPPFQRQDEMKRRDDESGQPTRDRTP
jgi:hypothetical protein